MKKILLLLVLMLTVAALFAQKGVSHGGAKATKPRPQSSSPTKTHVTYQNLSSSADSSLVGQVQHVVDSAPAPSRSTLQTASGPCENAPTVTFDGKTFELDCNALERAYDPLIFNYYRHYNQGSKFEDAEIRVQWDPNYLKPNVLGKSTRDQDIEAYREGDYTKKPGYQILRLSNGNVIMSYTSNLYDSVVIYRTFNLKNNQGGNIHLHIYGSNIVPKDVRGNKDKWEEWRAEMVDEAVAWTIPTPYK